MSDELEQFVQRGQEAEGPKLNLDAVLWCTILNPMFTEERRRLIRFLRYDKSVPCAECGKRNKAHWSMLCTFIAKSMGNSFFLESGKVHMPLTPVCQDHLLAPPAEWTPPPKEKKEKKNQVSNIRVEITDASEFHCFRLVLTPRVGIEEETGRIIPGPPIEIMLHARALVDLIHQCSSALCDWQKQTTTQLICERTGLTEDEARERGLIA